MAILQSAKKPEPNDLLERADLLRIDAFARLPAEQRSKLGQFPTPAPVAKLMAGMFRFRDKNIRLLDAGAGSGSLLAATVQEFCSHGGEAVTASAFELDASLAGRLAETLESCEAYCRERGVAFNGEVLNEDFICAGVGMLGGTLFGSTRFNCAILNPPYKKLNSDSEHRRMLRSVGIETSNLYTAFMALVVKLLEPGGEMVAIVPRSFCNGPYFRPFRELLLGEMAIDSVHMFETRTDAFQEDDVLQENVIFHAVKSDEKPESVTITSSRQAGEEPSVQVIPYSRLVNPNDAEMFIHIVTDDAEAHISDMMGGLSESLSGLGLNVSTGRVVDFRAKEYLRQEPGRDTVPLIYPTHFADGWIAWPRAGSKKPNAIEDCSGSANVLIPSAVHVLVKRFSAKEEKRRVVAAIFDRAKVPCARVGFENHVNYFHESGAGLSMDLAKGLAAFLNCSALDAYFRQFNGHTQVNATDLRNMKYPPRAKLERLGRMIGDAFPKQEKLDRLVEKELLGMAKDSAAGNALAGKKKIEEAIEALKALGLPKEQQNERSALTLLSLLDLKPTSGWKDAKPPLRGITPMMDYFAEHFGKKYAPNSRETVRRFTVHQFEQAGIIVRNPDKPRAVNSPDNVYQIQAGALELLKTFGTADWDKALKTWLQTNKTLREKYAAEREMQQVPVTLPSGEKVVLTQEGQNILIKHIVEDFCARFTPGGVVLYIGDTGDKHVVYDEAALKKLGIVIDKHGKMPDVVVYFPAKKWLVLIEAVTSHGPVNAKRHHELKELFKGSKVGLVYVTTFLDREAMRKYLPEIAWETEVWCADAPSHLIHFNGERFLGPY